MQKYNKKQDVYRVSTFLRSNLDFLTIVQIVVAANKAENSSFFSQKFNEKKLLKNFVIPK